jgi:hypothetical protein
VLQLRVAALVVVLVTVIVAGIVTKVAARELDVATEPEMDIEPGLAPESA